MFLGDELLGGFPEEAGVRGRGTNPNDPFGKLSLNKCGTWNCLVLCPNWQLPIRYEGLLGQVEFLEES